MIMRSTTSPLLIALNQLFLLAFFFAMRSCEYLKIRGNAERRTCPLRLRNLEFRTKENLLIPHDSPDLHLAATITITFEYQKKDLRNDSVTQSRTGHPLLCPVQAGAALVRRLRSFGATDDDFIYIFQDANGTKKNIDSKAALDVLRSFISTIDSRYGIDSADVGLHSIRSSAAMAMYLTGVPVYTIMLLGRWSSDAFLRYIRKQVTAFSNNVSRNMIRNPCYYHVPDPNPQNPRNRNAMSATANLGMGSSGSTINRSVFSVWE